MSVYTSPADLTMKRSPGGGGMVITLSFMCGHKGARAGSQMKHGTAWRCASCVKKETK